MKKDNLCANVKGREEVKEKCVILSAENVCRPRCHGDLFFSNNSEVASGGTTKKTIQSEENQLIIKSIVCTCKSYNRHFPQ